MAYCRNLEFVIVVISVLFFSSVEPKNGTTDDNPTTSNVELQTNASQIMAFNDIDSRLQTESSLTYIGARVNKISETFTDMSAERKLLVNLLILDILNPNVNWLFNFMHRIRRPHPPIMMRIAIDNFYTDITVPHWRDLDTVLIAVTRRIKSRKRLIEKYLQDLVTPLMSLIIVQKNNIDVADCTSLKNIQKVYMCFAKNMHLFENTDRYVVATALFAEFAVAHHKLEVEKLLLKKVSEAHTSFLQSTENYVTSKDYRNLHPYVLEHYDEKNITMSSINIYKLDL